LLNGQYSARGDYIEEGCGDSVRIYAKGGCKKVFVAHV